MGIDASELRPLVGAGARARHRGMLPCFFA